MSSRLLPYYLLRHYFFWLFVFFITRTVFLLWNREELAGAGTGETLASYWRALYIDTATACYFLVFPFLFLLLSALLKKEWPMKVNTWITLLLLIGVSLITIAELPIYDEWHHKLDYKALWFLQDPSEVFHTASYSQFFGGLLASAFLAYGFFYLYKKRIAPTETLGPRPAWITAAFGLLTPALLFTGIRGGFEPIPVQVSDAYYSKHNVLNLAALNSTFNLVCNCIESSKADEPYRFMPPAEAERIFTALNATPHDSTLRVLTTQRPNVVLVVLEGWSADLVKGCGGYDSITPNFDAMAREGILFTDCYASGSLSDQGMAAVFSAFPAQPKTSIITQPTKYIHLPCISTSFKKSGYKTSFLFGGQLSYGNIKAYMYYNGFDRILEGKDFDASIPQGKLGVPDEYLFERQLKELANEQQPFFAAMFTLSSHGPFDFPMEETLHWGDKEKPYINSVYYADRCIRDFIAGAKKTPWYKNTLFVFVSDHSHNSPKNWAFNQAEYRRIPMLFYGEVIRPEYRGMKYDSVASQTDLAATLLRQLNIDAEAYRFSKDLFNPSAPRYAWYAFDEGFGFVRPEGRLVWHVKDGRTEYERYVDSTQKPVFVKQGQAFLQVLMEEYFSY